MRSASERPIWRPYTQEKIALPPIEIARAEGAYLHTSDGRKIFDGISSWWVIAHGHCHPKIVEAIRRQAGLIDQVIFANFTHAPAEELSERLIRATPENLTRVFFTDNGSTAVESALKMTLQACEQRGQSGRRKFIAFERAYHGDTVGAMSVSAESLFTRPYKPALFQILRAGQPDRHGASASDFVADFDRIVSENHDSIAGVIIEPLLQAAGGMIVWPKEALRKIGAICKSHGIYLIFDEVMTGFGRTGSLFAMDQLGIVPDLLCLSKGLTGGTLPLAVTLASEEIYQAFLSTEKSKMFFHGHSFTGNPIACAAALASLKIFEEEKTLKRIEEINAAHRVGLARLEKMRKIANQRTCGTVAAFEIEGDKHGYEAAVSETVTKKALEKGLFVRPLGNTVYLLPPYCATRADLELAWEILADCV